MKATRLRTLLLWAAVAVITLASGLFASSPRVEAGPNPCPPLDPSNFVFFDCFDVGDTDGSDEANATFPVDSANQTAWSESESSTTGCMIVSEELRLSNVAGGVCTSVASPEVTISGYSQVTISFEWGSAITEATGTFAALLNQNSAGFNPLTTLSVDADDCDVDVEEGNCADTTFTTTIPLDCGEHTFQIQFTGPTAVGSRAFVDDVRFEGTEQTCIPDDVSTLQIEKFWNGEEPKDFTFLVEGNGCIVDVNGEGIDPPAVFVPIDGTFTITVMPPAATLVVIACDGPATITEQPDDGFVIGDVNCPPSVTVEDGSLSYDFPVMEIPEVALCLITNEPVEDTLDLTVEKVCVGEFEATFEVTVDGDTRPIACGEMVVFADLEPGTYELTETIQDGDEEGFTTIIVCDDTGDAVEATTRSVTLGSDDIVCVILNGADVDKLICPCPCPCGQDIEIDIDNSNTNVIGIENENKNENTNNNTNNNANTNTNTNTQDQTNNQSQDNSNTQTNNIDSSPEVNINFD
jgi:hypothetical protein